METLLPTTTVVSASKKTIPSCDEEADPPTGILERIRRSRIFTLALFASVTVLLYSDQSLIAPNLSAIAEDFDFSDKEKDRRLAGNIALAFFGFAALSSLLIGWLADIVDRRNLFVLIVLIGKAGALATVWVTTYSQLFWMRALAGIALGGGLPLVYSILGDLVETSRRTEASGIIGMAVGFGQGLGQVWIETSARVVAALTGRATSLGWRFPFMVLSVPCVALVALVYVATKDPPRGRSKQGLQAHFQAGGEYATQPEQKRLWRLAGCPTFILALLQGPLGCIPWGVIWVYLPDFLHDQRGLTIDQSSLIVTLFGLGASAGQVLGAKMGQLAYNRHSTLQPLLMGATTIGGALPCMMLIQYHGDKFLWFGLFAVISGILVAATGPNIRSVIMNVTLSRGMAFGLFNFFDEVGKGLGPALVSLIVVREGREKALTMVLLAWLGCGIILMSMAFTAQRDEAKVQAHLKEYAKMPIRSPCSSSPLNIANSSVENMYSAI